MRDDESVNRSALSANFCGFNSQHVEGMYVKAMTDALSNNPNEIDNILQSADMFIPSGAHRLRVVASKALLERASRRLTETSPFIR